MGDQDHGEKLTVEMSGPFLTSQDYLQYCLDHHRDVEDRHPLSVGARKLTGTMIRHLPSPRKARETFVMVPPDFDSQNIMIDERGNLTGIIDWDNVRTEPSFLGYSRFPGWITRDWDPLMYNYPETKRENSPEELKRYRSRYNRQITRQLNGRGDSPLTVKSHIFEAVAISALDSTCRLEIVRKIVDRVPPRDTGYDALDVVEAVGKGKLAPKEMRKLTQGLAALLSISRW